MRNFLSSWLLVLGALLGPLFSSVAMAETLQVNINGLGQVTSSPAGINCDQSGGEITDCIESNFGSTTLSFDLTATPASGWRILSWGGACAGSGSSPTCAVSILSDQVDNSLKLVSVEFEEQVLTVSLVGSGSGGVSGIPCEGFPCTVGFFDNPSFNLTATAALGSVFSGWSGGGCGTANSCTVLPPVDTADANVVVNALFELDGDGDGVGNGSDQCPETPPNTFVDGNGCPDPDGDGVFDPADQCPSTPPNTVVDEFGCPDEDSDGVPDTADQCPATPASEIVDGQGCSQSQLDDDDDGVSNEVDQCPLTPTNEIADGTGCSPSQLDDDDDGVSNAIDQCPATPAGEAVDGQGCSATELDEDLDGISNEIDQCPATPGGEPVDGQGCSASQLDDDDDGVSNDVDQCPATPAGESTDSSGCSDSQLDDDEDGVSNDVDQCPQTPAGASVDENGCSEAELDDDGDGVSNDLDQCPNTEPGSDIDGDGCADSQKDSDGDGINDEDDFCPSTDTDLPVDDDGCSEVQQFGNELGDLPGLSKNEQSLGSRIDEICPQLIRLEVEEDLTPGQQQLRSACSRLKNRDTSQDQAGFALGQISLTELASLTQNAVQSGMTQVRGTQQRVGQVNAGGGKGVSVAGLNLRSGNQVIPAHVLESAFKGLLGMGASEDSFADFGKLGIYVQGDLDFGDRDETAKESGYDFDAWNVSFGGDYRFTDSVYAGASLGFGEIDVDYARNGGESDISNWTLSTYAGWQITEHWFLDGMFNYGQSDFDTVRRINYTDVGGQFESSQKGKTDGEQIFVGLNTGYMFNREGWRFGPIASLTYLDGSIDGYTERAQGDSSDAWSFLVDDQDYKSLRISAGGQLDYAISTSFGVLIPGVRATWVYENEDGAEQIGLRLANNPFSESSLDSDQIIIETDGVDSNFLDASFNLSGQFVMGVSGYMSYQFYSSYENYSQSGFTIGLRWDKPF